MARSRRKHAVVSLGTDDEAVNYRKAARKRDRKKLRCKNRNALSKITSLENHREDSRTLQERRDQIVFAAETIPSKAPRSKGICIGCEAYRRRRCKNHFELTTPNLTSKTWEEKRKLLEIERYEKTGKAAVLAPYRQYKYK
jgi:hypothetical protein